MAIKRLAQLVVFKQLLRATRRQSRAWRFWLGREIRELPGNITWRKPVHVAAVGLLLGAIVAPIASWAYANERYRLDDAMKLVVERPSPMLASKLKYAAAKQATVFNAEGEKNTQDSTHDKLQTAVGAGAKQDNQLYTATMPDDASQGVEIHDNVNDVSVKFVPQISLMSGRVGDGQVLYPLKDENGQMIFTPKANGVKEDILLNQAPSSDTMQVAYRLDMAKSIEPRLEQDGSIGFYTASQELYGNISYGTDKDRELVEKGRENSPKTYLMFKIPRPVVRETGSKSAVDARFGLSGNTLTVAVSGLQKAHYPLSVDPTFLITTTADFVLGAIDDNIDLTTADQVTRATLSGGSTPNWAPNTGVSMTNGNYAEGIVAYNSALYMLGGANDDAGSSNVTTNKVRYIKLQSDGTPGSNVWTWASNNMQTARQGLAAFGYNGYLYAVGGVSSAGTPISTVEVAQITSTGDVGAWHYTAHLGTARGYLAGAVYQGVLYAMGGSSTSVNGGLLNTTEYSRVNGNGSLGHCVDAVDPTYLSNCTWDTGTTLSAAARNRFVGGAYNGWVYVAGGRTATPSVLNTIEAAPIQSDGSLGTWTTTGMTAFPTARRDHGIGLQNGHIYIYGGCSSATIACPSFLGDTQYAVLNADGTIGQWQSSVPYNNGGYSARIGQGSAVYNNFLYFVGGCATENANGVNCSAMRTGTFYTGFDTPGRFDRGESTQGSPPYSGTSTVARMGGKSIAMNGYVYYVSGCSTSACGSYDPTVEYASISNDGTLGNFSTTTSLPTGTGGAGRLGHTLATYNNKMYVIGGTERPLAPSVSSVMPTTVGTAATAHQINMPSGTVNAGDLLLTLITVGANVTITTPSGWTSIGTAQNTGATMRAAVFAKSAAGTEGGTTVNFVTSGSATAAAQVYRVPSGQWQGTVASAVSLSTAAVSNGTTTPDPASLTPSWGSANNLWIAFGAGLGYTNVTTYPTSYSNGTHTTTGTGSPNASVSSATRYIDATAENPGTFTEANSVAEVAYTVAIQPAAISDIYPTTILSATQNSNGTLGAWGAETNGLPAARAYATSAVWHNYVYVLGGRDASSVYGTVYYAQISAAGAIGTWSTTTTGIAARWGHSGGIWGNWLYVIGGQTDTAGTYIGTTSGANAMQQLTITNTGNITASATGYATNTTRRFADGFVHNGYIYQFGGNLSSSTTQVADISWTALDPATGAPGTLVTTNIGNSPDQTVGMATARSQAGVVDAGGYIYVLGGCTSAIAATAFRACTSFVPTANTSELYVPNAGGTGQTTSFTSSTAMSAARSDHSAVAYNGKLYVLGGCTAYTSGACTTSVTTVESTSMNPDGSLSGSWTSLTSLPVERSSLQVAAYNGYMYAVGGMSNSAAQNNNVWYTAISNTGTLGASWTASANTLGTARRAFGMAILKGFIYVAGGIGASGRLNDVQYATLDQFSGSVGTWTTNANSFTTARTGFGFAGYNGRLYVAGGYDGTNILKDVQFATINSDGSVGAFAYTTDVARGLDVGQMTGANGYMYFIGTNGDRTEFEYADINANGTLSPIQRSANTMAGAHAHGAATWFDGEFYVLGACTVDASDNCNASPTGTTERAGQQAISRTGHYSKLFDTQVDTTPTQLVINGTVSGPGSAVEMRFQTASSTDPILGVAQLIRPVIFGNYYNVQSLNSSGTFVGQAFKYQYVITLDDSRAGTFPDVPNTGSGFAKTSVQDITLFYHANPARRLRHGASFTNSGCNATVADGCILDTAP